MTTWLKPPASQATAAESQTLDWEQIYLDLAPRVFNYVRYRLGQERDAQELTSRTFEKAWIARKRYRSDLAGFSTWLFKIAHNVTVDYVRTRREFVPIDGAAEIAAAETGATLEQQSDLARLGVLTRALQPRDRDLIALKYGAGMSNRDIAKITGLSESNVGSILHRLVRELRARW